MERGSLAIVACRDVTDYMTICRSGQLPLLTSNEVIESRSARTRAPREVASRHHLQKWSDRLPKASHEQRSIWRAPRGCRFSCRGVPMFLRSRKSWQPVEITAN